MDQKSATLLRRAWPRQLIFLFLVAAMLFLPAGSLRYWQAWLFLIIFVGASVAIGAYFVVRDPALVERRMNVGVRAEQEPAQKVIVGLIMLGFLMLMIVPGFDYRWHWSSVPVWLVILGNVGIAACFAIFFFVMEQNSYAASTIRVEANQPVVSTGLYAIVRHPMYSGALLLMICIPLALGSYWGLLLLLLLVPVLVWRLIDEERYLKANLPGYADYCRRVRYRLIPGVW